MSQDAPNEKLCNWCGKSPGRLGEYDLTPFWLCKSCELTASIDLRAMTFSKHDAAASGSVLAADFLMD